MIKTQSIVRYLMERGYISKLIFKGETYLSYSSTYYNRRAEGQTGVTGQSCRPSTPIPPLAGNGMHRILKRTRKSHVNIFSNSSLA